MTWHLGWLKNICFNYENNQVLKGIDLPVYKGEILGIIGPNGSGKSTLLKVMDGVLNPDQGEIFIKGYFNLWTEFGTTMLWSSKSGHFLLSRFAA